MDLFRKINTGDSNLQRIQDNIEKVLNPLARKEISDGLLIEDVAIVSGTMKSIDHGLGRKLRGWFAVRVSANAVIWDNQSTNLFPTRTLNLQSSANVTVSLWVF